MNNLIEIIQLPELVERFESVGIDMKHEVEFCRSLAVTEENRREIKDKRSELRKKMGDVHKQFLKAKDEILEPWDRVESSYMDNVRRKFFEADAELKTKIDEVENELKAKKIAETKRYFEEYAISQNVDFLKYENMQQTVRLSDSKKSLKDRAKKYIDNVVEDIITIAGLDNELEILVEYKKCLNVASAIRIVTERKKALDDAIKSAEELEKALEAEKAVEEAVDEVLAPPEKILVAEFRCKGTRNQLTALAEYMKKYGIEYENLEG